MSDTTDTETATTRRPRRTRAQIAADEAALQAAHDADTIPTAEFITILRDWQSRYSVCSDAERYLQRSTGLRFMARSYDYENGSYDEDDRFTPRPGSPEHLDKARVARAVKSCKRNYGAGGYGLNWLEKQLTDKFGLTVKEYNDSYKVVYEFTVTAEQLRGWGWNGDENQRTIGDHIRYNQGMDWRTPTSFDIVPDPTRATDAAAREAKNAATKAAAEAAATTETADSGKVAETPATEPAAEEIRRTGRDLREALQQAGVLSAARQ